MQRSVVQHNSYTGIVCAAPFFWRAEGGGGQGGGMAPGRKPWRGASQVVGANFKKKIRPRQISKVTSLQCRINLVAKV